MTWADAFAVVGVTVVMAAPLLYAIWKTKP